MELELDIVTEITSFPLKRHILSSMVYKRERLQEIGGRTYGS